MSQTIWCRTLTEERKATFSHDNSLSKQNPLTAKRFMLIFSPMYTARSLLPEPMMLLLSPAANAPDRVRREETRLFLSLYSLMYEYE